MEKMVMVDQDGVVCDKNYQVTKDIKRVVCELSEAGMLIIPNSDTPVERLINNFELLLGIKPCITIAEKGAVVRIKEKDFLLGGIEDIDGYITALEVAFKEATAEITIGDSATWIRQKKRFRPHSKMLIIDGLRRQSIGFYLKMTDGSGLPFTDETWSSLGMEIAKSVERPRGLTELDYNSKYGIAIGNAAATKTTGYMFLKRLFPDRSFFMIGDAEMDIIEDNGVVHCTVDNATDSIKKRSHYVSKCSLTEGLEDCLNWIKKF